jgi:MPBQ/MSBQ methyltransferase
MFKDKGIDMSLHYEFNRQLYDPESISGKFRMKMFVRILGEYLNAKKGKALDIGCAMGISSFAIEQLGFKATGIDTSREFIKKAKDIASKKKFTTKFYVKKATDIESLKESFNVVTFMGNPLPHFSIEELDSAIRKSWNVLNIDGVIFFHYMDWVARLFSSYQRVLVENNQENEVMLSYHSELDTVNGAFERLFLQPEEGQFFKGRFHIWSPWIIEFLLKHNRFKKIESENLEGHMWITRAIR